MGGVFSYLFGENDDSNTQFNPAEQDVSINKTSYPFVRGHPDFRSRNTYGRERPENSYLQHEVYNRFLRPRPEILLPSVPNYRFMRDFSITTSTVLRYVILEPSSQEYQNIQTLFFSTNKRQSFIVNRIERVDNPYLMCQYELKKLEYRSKGTPVNERILFHGTKQSNIDSICVNNFNWRLRGTGTGHRFGQGVNFASVAYYATHYGDTGKNKVMIVARVLIGNECKGTHDMTFPPPRYDTTTNEKKHVWVKYDDDTFHPLYVIYYEEIAGTLDNEIDELFRKLQLL